MLKDIKTTLGNINREMEEKHAAELAAALGLNYINLSGYPMVEEVLAVIPEEMATIHKVVPYLRLNNQVKVGVVDPNDIECLNYLDQISKEKSFSFNVSVISQSSLLYALENYKLYREKEVERQAKHEQELNDIRNLDIKDMKSAAEAAKSASTTKLLDVLLVGAMRLDASDIHFEPIEGNFVTRYRVDGVLQEIVVLPLIKYHQLVSRIKFMSGLRMDISDKPQDGRFSFAPPDGEAIDFRVSLMPSAYGESIVLRLLNTDKAIIGMDKMGFRPDALNAIKSAVSKPHGMVITSGPTGSGKSTTLYAVLMTLKKPGVKIITLEDPVEYKIDGIEQSQVKPGLGYEFADGLRASLRQDPDILMVGEIRDLQTAEIAVQAALTGHLLLSTIHANSAPAVYARFIDMGVKPFLLSGSINLIMAQRLVRRVCQKCAEKYQPEQAEWSQILERLLPYKARIIKEVADKLTPTPPVLLRAKGCPECSMTGYSGREVIVEYIIPNEVIETLITQKASIMVFEREALRLGMITMETDGLIKAIEGSTTKEEVWRVTKG
ncbi:MAG: GspE/PulE family protein [Candidatus Berkelbacteria bacterium]|nr:GspE/PulE family protein [Candidatus Berkelbacteria bacterium]